MEFDVVYHGRRLTHRDILFIRRLIANNPDKSRWFISRELCRQWDWRQPNGVLKDMICRGLLLRLQRDGLIALPPCKRIINNPLLNRQPPELIKVDQSPIIGNIEEVQPIELRSVRKTQYERLYNSLIHQYHYLGYTQPVGEKLKYIAFSHDRPIACLGYSSSVWHIGCRDRFIGWSPQLRKKNLHLIAYNNRFLILPWVKVPSLASHLLSLSARTIPSDWLRFYGHPVYFLETFVDTERFRGTCYKAANWILLGKTTGRGKNDQTNRQNRSLKTVFGYPLHQDFRRILCS
ncbi:Druantia anti-phage system protein DruA [Candidatus Hakubella thermalkaliphila]|uniref:Uncharacterized protein n=2 Tax=Candidatus Hakubella thermalkaliphila TaxID=2754717 RepID=A0A6V8Q4B6_9ACTN|nr:Druantia anti-phage system protein DruA [Candidatus Hakubella thermalkaliphila]GFP39437.1 hypothetical protein HKBW3S47_01136 [Candidatus Hakubella thermalkaliphila]